MTYDALLCDLDGVLRHWPTPGHADLDQRHGLPPGTLAATAFAPERLLPAITGRVTDEQWRAGVAEALAERHGPPARQAVADWSAVEPRVDTELVALLEQVRGRLRLVLVTNATTRLEADLARQGLDRLPHAVLNTARVGAAKPDPRVYRLAAELAGADLHRCLFVDDTAANVEAARTLGMPAHHYRGIAALRTLLGAS
ncbi:hydrolase [Streptomyces tateyamensis]|uniref:Hydrolase n=1 Tax=Streptomyces tateyamensis TaxID=565073 RepID=A0A2V4NYL2_9ACTN|nr:HAD-IA family hydrolase [Streptomyces tateyamensis]PYC68620.1 hydrolase [Streptomyces tateyamensis]